ncbi:MAG: inositol 2-dehydrogenase [Pseudomonadota bacterium]
MTLKLALLGAGRIGNVHADAIASNPNATLVAVTDAMADAAAALAAKHHGCEVHSMEAIESDANIDAVIICTPTDMHADLIERFARAGKAIFCEKPIDLSAARVRECLAVVEETDARLMVGFNRRFDPSFAAVRQAIDNGSVGDVELVQITSRDPEAPPASYATRAGGMLRDMTIHDFDIARFLLGAEPVAVSAHASAITGQGVEEIGDIDTATIILETAGGQQAVITNSRRATYGYDQRIEVHGSKGMAHAENMRPHNAEIATGDGYSRAPLEDFFMTRYVEAYRREIAGFVNMLKNDAPASPSGEDGLRALLLADAAYISIEEKRRVMVSELA